MKKISPEKEAIFYRITVSDIILVLLIFSFTISTVIFARQDMDGSLSDSRKISIFQDGKKLEQSAFYKDQDITLLDGDIVIEIKGNKLRVKKSNCSLQTCVHMGWISHPGETIACLPNKILIEIESSDSSVVDAVIY